MLLISLLIDENGTAGKKGLIVGDVGCGAADVVVARCRKVSEP